MRASSSERERAKRALEQSHAQLEQRVEERTRELTEANTQLSATIRELEEFTAAASHDLRSPLGSIGGQAGLLEMQFGEMLGEKGRDRLQRIYAAVKRASEVIDGLLALAGISKATLLHESICLTQVAQQVLKELHEADPDRVCEAYVQPDMQLYADPRLIRSLVTNLLSNAWKYSSKKPLVQIRVDRIQQGDEVVYRVSDNGVGFQMSYAHKLFHAFHRLHSPAEFEGTGIGLATVARIIARYGGRIWAEGQPQQGATFYFTLPNAQIASE